MCHVLIIEDEHLTAMLVQALLEDEGATSFSFAASQDAALAAAISRPPDVITSDVQLTSGTGPLAVDAIHHQLGDIPVIFITATPAQCEPCEPPGVVLSKPIDHGQLAAAFHNIILG